MPEFTDHCFHADVETAIAGYRRQVRRALEVAGRSGEESEGIVADVEQHLRAQLPDGATLVQVEAVLARMDPPEAYAGEAAAARSPITFGHVVGVFVVLICGVAALSGLHYLAVDAQIGERHGVVVVEHIPAAVTTASTMVPPEKGGQAVAPPGGFVDVPVAEKPMAIAVLEFQGSDNLVDRATVTTELTDGIINALAARPDLRVVERERLQAAFQELRLSAEGAVQQETAVSVGRLIGARVIVLGNLTRVGDRLTATARLLNPETGELAVVREEGAVGAVAALADLVAAAVAEKLTRVKADLAGKALPRVLVMIPESHLGGYVRDPAAETELVRWLIECEFLVASPEYEGVHAPRPATDTSADTEIAFHNRAGWRNTEGAMTIASRVLREAVTGGSSTGSLSRLFRNVLL